MTLLAALFGICATVLFVAYEHNRTRAYNLDVLNADLRDQLATAHYALDDATRNLAHVRHLHAALLSENNTLLVDLCHAEQRANYVCAHQRQRNAMLAGTVLLLGAPNPRKHLYAKTMESVP